MSLKVYEEVNYPNNKFKMNQKWHDWTFYQSLLLLCTYETGKTGFVTHVTFWCHTRHALII